MHCLLTALSLSLLAQAQFHDASPDEGTILSRDTYDAILPVLKARAFLAKRTPPYAGSSPAALSGAYNTGQSGSSAKSAGSSARRGGRRHRRRDMGSFGDEFGSPLGARAAEAEALDEDELLFFARDADPGAFFDGEFDE